MFCPYLWEECVIIECREDDVFGSVDVPLQQLQLVVQGGGQLHRAQDVSAHARGCLVVLAAVKHSPRSLQTLAVPAAGYATKAQR